MPRARRARAEYLDALSFALPDEAVVACDMCIPGYWAAAFHPFAHPRKLLYPLGWGTLGFAFPAAIGAALADAGPTVAICGDGGFLFACGELATVAQEHIPLTTVIVDDGGYGMLRYDQDLAGSERFGVDLRTPDFEALARSFGLRAETVDDVGEAFGEALERTSPTPSRACWWRGRRRSRLRPPRHRTGTGVAAKELGRAARRRPSAEPGPR